MDAYENMSSDVGGSMNGGDTDEEMDWEEVVVPAANPGSQQVMDPPETNVDFQGHENIDITLEDVPQAKNIEITLSRGKKTDSPARYVILHPGSVWKGVLIGDFQKEGSTECFKYGTFSSTELP